MVSAELLGLSLRSVPRLPRPDRYPLPGGSPRRHAPRRRAVLVRGDARGQQMECRASRSSSARRPSLVPFTPAVLGALPVVHLQAVREHAARFAGPAALNWMRNACEICRRPKHLDSVRLGGDARAPRNLSRMADHHRPLSLAMAAPTGRCSVVSSLRNSGRSGHCALLSE